MPSLAIGPQYDKSKMTANASSRILPTPRRSGQ
jgi:hypothetical protein